MSWNVQKAKQQFNDACNAYLEVFCEKHGFDYGEAKNSWIANEVGGSCLLGDYCVTFWDMKVDIDMEAQKEEYWNYYEYSLEAHDLGLICPNYASWIRGCPRISEELRKSLREAKKRVYEAQKDFERILKKEKEKLAGGF